MPEQKLTFTFETATKNAIRYKEVPEPGHPAVIGTLYVQKTFAGDAKEIQLTVVTK